MNIFLVFCIRGNSSMKIIDLSFNVEPNLSEPMSIKIKTRPHSGGSKFGRKIIFMGKRSLKVSVQ